MNPRNTELSRILRALLPSKLELISIPILSFLFLTGLNSFQWLRSAEGKNSVLVIEFVQLRFKAALTYLDSILGSTIPSVIFWALVGMIVYVIMWLIVSAWQAYRDDLPADGRQMIVPKGYNHARALRGSIVRIFIRVIAVALLIVWGYLLFAEILPYSTQLFLEGVNVIALDNTYRSLLAAALLASSVFIIHILTRCAVLRVRVFG